VHKWVRCHHVREIQQIRGKVGEVAVGREADGEIYKEREDVVWLNNDVKNREMCA
jgi:hypothetical protein